VTTYRLEYTRRPWTENAMRREHFHTRARLVTAETAEATA
jgi:hypothetical protein